MSTSVSNGNAKSRRRTNPKQVRFWLITGSTILFAIIVFAIIRGQGHVYGTEFSPTHFTTREYSFIEIPLLGIQITPIKRVDTTSDIATYIRTKNLIPKLPGKQKIWHPSTITRGFSAQVDRDAQLLIDQFEIQDQSSTYWQTWSIDHPKKAALLWPIVAKLAQRELYVLLPGIFEIAQSDSSIEEFSAQTDQYLVEEYASVIEDMRAAKKTDLADQLLNEARADYPNNTNLKSLQNGDQ